MQAFKQAKEIKNPTGLWLIQGDEPIIASWLLDSWRKQWIANQVERKRFEIIGNKTSVWHEALSEFDMMGLFSSQTVVELHGNTKPDKTGLQKLARFCEQPDENCLVVVMPAQDWRAKKTVFYKQCQQLGNVLETTLSNEKERQDLLSIKAEEFGLLLSQSAWQLLLTQTQNNLLSAYQALWRMSDLAVINHSEQCDDNGNIPIDEHMLKPALVAQSRYNQYDLCDAVLKGNIASVIEIISYLRESGEAPSVVLWNLAKDARLITQLVAGANLKLPAYQLNKYRTVVARTNLHTTQGWQQLLLDSDKAIKGVINRPAWEILTELSLSMAGKPLFVR